MQSLRRHGFLEVVGTQPQGARPERTVYRITEATTSRRWFDFDPDLLSAHRSLTSKVRRRALGAMILSPTR